MFEQLIPVVLDGHEILVPLYDLVVQCDLKCVSFRADGCNDVFVLRLLGHLELLPAYIKLAVTSDESDEVYAALSKSQVNLSKRDMRI